MRTADDQQDEAVAPAAAESDRGAALPQALLTTVARLRAFAVLLCMNVDLAEQLVAITLSRAGVAIKPSSIGPNLFGWLLSRLRQYYYREYVARSVVPQPSTDWQSHHGRHQDVLAALAELTAEQREALVLVDAAGCSPREAAHICRCTPIQFRNRLAGARDRLTRQLAAPTFRPDNVTPLTVAFAALTGARVMAIGRYHS